MSQEQATLLKRALIQGVSERYDAELAESKKSVACSQAHLLKMSEILGFDVQKSPRARRRKRVAAAIILAAALAIGSLTAYGYREQIREFFIRVFEEYIVLEFKGEQVQGGVSERYRINYFPEGYMLTMEEFSEAYTKYEWSNEKGQTLSFSQRSLNTEFRYDAEYGSYTVIEHNGLQIWYKKGRDSMSYLWSDGKYAMYIFDRTELPLDEICKMIDSIYE